MLKVAKFQKYHALFCLTFWQAAKNRNMLIGLGVFTITCLVIFSHLWQVAAIGHLEPALLLWYIALNEWVLISIPDIHLDMQHELQSGSLAYSMVRPISYLLAKFSEGFAILTLQLLFLGVVTFAFTYFWTNLLPFNFSESLLVLFLGLMAGSLGLIFQMLVGLSSFWLQDVTPFSWVWEKLLYVFGGLILPLLCYPPLMQQIASYTPFPAILGARSALALDFSLQALIDVALSLALWLVLGILLLNFVFRRAMKILNVQGG